MTHVCGTAGGLQHGEGRRFLLGQSQAGQSEREEKHLVGLSLAAAHYIRRLESRREGRGMGMSVKL